MKHTPGPWKESRAKERDNTGGWDYAILDGNNKIIAEAFENVGFASGSTVIHDFRPVEANARLIASAPELLEALDTIAKLYERLETTGTTSQHAVALYDARCIARTAICKATGEKEVA